VVGTHSAPFVRRLIGTGENANPSAGIVTEVVPLVGEVPDGWQAPGGGVAVVLDHQLAELVCGVTVEAGAEEFAVVRPVVLGAGCCVHPDKATTRVHVVDEVFPSGEGQDLAAGGEKDHGRLSVQRSLQGLRNLAVVDRVAVQGVYGGDSLGDGVVAEAGGARAHE
jgi:hypothetical protein